MINIKIPNIIVRIFGRKASTKTSKGKIINDTYLVTTGHVSRGDIVVIDRGRKQSASLKR